MPAFLFGSSRNHPRRKSRPCRGSTEDAGRLTGSRPGDLGRPNPQSRLEESPGLSMLHLREQAVALASGAVMEDNLQTQPRRAWSDEQTAKSRSESDRGGALEQRRRHAESEARTTRYLGRAAFASTPRPEDRLGVPASAARA